MTIRKSNRGVPLNMDAIIGSAGKLTPAVGNMRVNAQGDVLGPAGEIVTRNEERVRNYYKRAKIGSATTSLSPSRKNTASLTPDAPPPPDQPAEFDAPTYQEVEHPNGDIEVVATKKPKGSNLA